MSKFDTIYNRIQEDANILGIQTNPQQQNQNNQQQTPNNQNNGLENLAKELAKINDPTKIQQILAAMFEQPQQQKPVTQQNQATQ